MQNLQKLSHYKFRFYNQPSKLKIHNGTMTWQFSIPMPPPPEILETLCISISVHVSIKTQRSIKWSTTYNFYRTTQNWISFYMSTYKKYVLS